MKLGDYLSIKQAAEFSGYSERHIRYLINKDRLEGVKVGSMIFITEISLQAYVSLAAEKATTDKRYKA